MSILFLPLVMSNKKSPPLGEALCETIDSVNLTSVPSQAMIAPLTEELATEKATQSDGKWLKDHFIFPQHLTDGTRNFIIDQVLWQGFLNK